MSFDINSLRPLRHWRKPHGGPAMSYVVEAHCHEYRFGSAVRKQITMFLANNASDDGSGI